MLFLNPTSITFDIEIGQGLSLTLATFHSELSTIDVSLEKEALVSNSITVSKYLAPEFWACFNVGYSVHTYTSLNSLPFNAGLSEFINACAFSFEVT